MWDIISDYWLYFLVGNYPNGPVGGLALTLWIAAVSLILTFPGALLVALARTSGRRVLVAAATAYVYGIRGMPLLLFIFWIYFGLPLLIGTPLTPVVTLIAALVLYQMAYLSEVIRAGIEAISRGQTDAARALGLRYVPIMAKVILPQALYNVIPGILNQLTYLIKETLLGYIITVEEVTRTADHVNSHLMTKPMQVFALLAAIYFVVAFGLSRAARGLDLRIARRRRGPLSSQRAAA